MTLEPFKQGICDLGPWNKVSWLKPVADKMSGSPDRLVSLNLINLLCVSPGLYVHAIYRKLNNHQLQLDHCLFKLGSSEEEEVQEMKSIGDLQSSFTFVANRYGLGYVIRDYQHAKDLPYSVFVPYTAECSADRKYSQLPVTRKK